MAAAAVTQRRGATKTESDDKATGADDTAAAASSSVVGQQQQQRGASNSLPAVDRGLARLYRLFRLSLPPYSEDHQWEKDDVSAILHWQKQFLGVVLGLLFGVLHIKGWVGFAIAGGCIYSASSTFLRAAHVPDLLFTPTEAAQEGLWGTFMTFVLFWSLAHTILHTL